MIESMYSNRSLEMKTSGVEKPVTWSVPVPEEVAANGDELSRFIELHVDAFKILVKEAAQHAA